MTRLADVGAAFAERFGRDLDVLIPPGEALGIAVSGGPDSLALLLLAHAARPTDIHAVTVDHGLRSESAAEAAFVASVCEGLGVPHRILKLDWPSPPDTAIQEKARVARYNAVGRWAGEQAIAAILTGHHRDDQAETLLMRLARGSGVSGLAAMRRSATIPGQKSVRLLRPLLAWGRAELEAVCVTAGVAAIQDPSNHDQCFERVRMRAGLASAEWLDAAAVARSAANLAEADEALEWAVQREWRECVTPLESGGALYAPQGPAEIRRRILARLIVELGTEGGSELRGRELDHVLKAWEDGRSATLRGILCSGGDQWRFTPAPARRQ